MGKSTLMRELRPDLEINLAHEPTFLSFARDPNEVEARLGGLRAGGTRTVFIDEIQRLPGLLNTIQTILDRPGHGLRFLLTGSSARKLRRGEVNLLPGRIHAFRMGPLTSSEMGHDIVTPVALAYGTLPGIVTAPHDADREKTLSTYAAIYLREEVQAESLSRSLEGFARFLTAIAKSATRRLVEHPKFYFFDVGVLNGLLGNFTPSPDRVGMLFEHLVYTQIVHSGAAFDETIKVSTFRTEHGPEVDFIVERGRDLFAIEAKASRTVSAGDLWGLARFADYAGRKHRPMVWYLGRERKRINGVDILPWQQGLEALGW